MKDSKNFSWKFIDQPKVVTRQICFQTQCRSGGGGNGKCSGKCSK